MLTLSFLIKTLINFYVLILLFRVWIQWVQCDSYNSFSKCIIQMTQPIVQKIQCFIPSRKNIDFASIFLSFILGIIKIFFLMSIEVKTFLFSPIFCLFLGVLSLIKAIGSMIFWIIIFRSILTWIDSRTSPEINLIYQLSEPFFYNIRRIIPIINQTDFSGVILIFIIYFLNYLGMRLLPNVWYFL